MSKRCSLLLLALVAAAGCDETPFDPATGLPAGEATARSTALVGRGSVWRYLADGSAQGSAWRAAAFDDAGWPSGPAQLGYGDGDEATVVPYGPSATSKYVTTYFRRAFAVADPSAYSTLDLGVQRDDGAIVYLNGVEVLRTNMPAGAVTSTTLASTATTDEVSFFRAAVSPALLVAGTNVLAVEVHQAAVTSSDLSFDLELFGQSSASVVRGPYLQLATATSIVVRWRTDAAVTGRVRYGTAPGALTELADEAAARTEHEVALTGLTAGTTYYYSVGTAAEELAGDASYHFTTAPSPGVASPTRIWVLADSGTADATAGAVRDAFASYTGARGADLILMLGDNAYNDGTDAEYQAAVFDTFPTWLRAAPLWPAFGNHDGHTADSATQTGPYYDIFSLPAAGQAGGVASGTEAYYSFDRGAIHFISLDSAESSRAAGGPMLTWLAADLAARPPSTTWTIVYFHHPPYTRGKSNCDVDLELVEMRQNAVPILEAYGVDLVLGGDSHVNERSFLLDGHYGLSTTFAEAMKLDPGSGRVEDGGAYVKPTAGPGPHEGVVYAVVGSAALGSGTLDHPAMFSSLLTPASLVVDIDGDRLDAHSIDRYGATADHFTIIKEGCGPDGTACDDGDACTTSDTCQGGACVGASPIVCVALGACHVAGACDPATGACSDPLAPDGTACDDGNGCTTSTCMGGACVGSEPVVCAPLDQCHVAGACDPATGACTNPIVANGTACDDGNACLRVDACADGTCVGSDPVACAPLDQCHVAGACDPATGACTNPIVANGTACDDGNACTSGESCQAGACVGGASTCEVTISFRDGQLPTTAYTGTRDAYLNQSKTSTKYGTATGVLIDGDDPANSTRDLVGLLQFDVSAIPAGSVVVAASITLQVTNGTAHAYQLYGCQRAWVEAQATWNVYATGASWQVAGAAGAGDRGSTVLGTLGPAAIGSTTLSLTAAGLAQLQAWIADPASNHGFVIANTTSTDGIDVVSSEATTIAQRPRLTVTYRRP